MGWAGGARLADALWHNIRPLVSESNRQWVALAVIDHFEGEDCDTMDECFQLMADADPQLELDKYGFESRSEPLRPRTGPPTPFEETPGET